MLLGPASWLPRRHLLIASVHLDRLNFNHISLNTPYAAARYLRTNNSPYNKTITKNPRIRKYEDVHRHERKHQPESAFDSESTMVQSIPNPLVIQQQHL